jgi:AcrR family transcriptional regulator
MSSSPEHPKSKDSKSDRVQAILAAALEEFIAQGFASARLDTIAERAGVAKGTLYLYFDSKETLFEAAVRGVISPVIERLEGAVFAPQGSAAALLETMIGIFYHEVVGTDRRKVIRVLIGEGPRFPRLLGFYHGEVVSRGMAALRRLIDYGVTRGEFRPSAASEFPQLIIGPAMVAAIWTMLFSEFEPLDLEKYSKAHIDHVLNALRLPARP